MTVRMIVNISGGNVEEDVRVELLELELLDEELGTEGVMVV